MAKVRNCVWVSLSSILTIAHNLFRQFLNVTFNEIFCILALFLFYGTPAEYIASGNSWWLLWPKCWLETEFDCRFRLRFSQFNQLNQTNCAPMRPICLSNCSKRRASAPLFWPIRGCEYWRNFVKNNKWEHADLMLLLAVKLKVMVNKRPTGGGAGGDGEYKAKY